MSLNESIVGDAALTWFGELGYAIGHGSSITPGELASGRNSFGDAVLVRHFREALQRRNQANPICLYA